jgi:probable F420-dependent oxidoreductase
LDLHPANNRARSASIVPSGPSQGCGLDNRREDDMEFWANLPVFGPDIDGKMLADLAEAAEELAFDAIVLPDHMIMPADFQPEEFRTNVDSFIAMAYIAARTSTIRLGHSVLPAPLRHPLALAKQFAALDVLSGGRVFMGLGVGSNEPEFKLVDVDFHTRGARLDELIALLRHLFSGSSEPFTGRFTTLVDYSFLPLPLQGETMPIMIGGQSEAALRRAAAHGDMWQASAYTPEEFAPVGARVKSMAGDRTITVGAETRMGCAWRARLSEEDGDLLRSQVAAWHDAGCDHLSIGFRRRGHLLEDLQFFAREVFPAYR